MYKQNHTGILVQYNPGTILFKSDMGDPVIIFNISQLNFFCILKENIQLNSEKNQFIMKV